MDIRSQLKLTYMRLHFVSRPLLERPYPAKRDTAINSVNPMFPRVPSRGIEDIAAIPTANAPEHQYSLR
jgi:hypothetical protein